MSNEMKAEISCQEIMLPTGKCLNCGIPLEKHPLCEACTCLVGMNHEQSLVKFRGHNVCGQCKINWGRQDRKMGRKTSWEEFRKQSPQIQSEVLARYEGKTRPSKVEVIAKGGR